MYKYIISILFLIMPIFGYVTPDLSYNTGGTQTQIKESFFSNNGLTQCSGNNCSNVWHYNATRTENLKLLDNSKFFNPNIVDDTLKK